MLDTRVSRSTFGMLGSRAQPKVSRLTHRFLFFLCLVTVTATTWAVCLVVASYSGQDLRGAQRSPAITQESTGTSQVAYVLDRLAGTSTQFTVAYIIPTDYNTTPPPGLERWPEAGEVFLSPALHDAGLTEGIEDRYGNFAGEISPAGLVRSDELFAYVNPVDRPLIPQRFLKVSYYGTPTPIFTGMLLDRPPITQPFVAIALILGVPTLLFCGTIVKLGRHGRRYESTILHTLGANKGEIALWHLGKVWRTFLAWFLVAMLSLIAMCHQDLLLPIVSFELRADDVHRMWLLFAVSSIITTGSLVCVWAVASTRSLANIESTRPRVSAETYSTRRAKIGLVAAPLSIVVATLGAGRYSLVAFLAFVILAVTVLICLPDTIGVLLNRIAQRLRTWSKNRNDPELLVGAAVAESRSHTITQMAVISCITIVIGIVLQTILGVFSQADPKAEATYAQFKDTVLIASVDPHLSSQQIKSALAQIEKAQPVRAMLVTERINDDTGVPQLMIATTNQNSNVLTINRDAAKFLAGRMRLAGIAQGDLKSNLSISDVLDERSSPTADKSNDGVANDWELWVVSNSNDALNIPALKQAIFMTSAPMSYMHVPDESWIVASTQASKYIEWIELFVVIGVVFVVLGLVSIAADENADALRRLARLNELSGRKLHTARISFVRVALPLGSGFVIGLTLATMFGLCLVLLYDEDPELLTQTLPPIVSTTLCVFFGAWLATTASLKRLMKGEQ